MRPYLRFQKSLVFTDDISGIKEDEEGNATIRLKNGERFKIQNYSIERFLDDYEAAHPKARLKVIK